MSGAPVDPQRWRRLSELFEQAGDLAPGARDAFIAALDDADAALAPELRAMLDADAAELPIDAGVDALQLPQGPAPRPPHEIGTVLGSWRLDAVLGHGGMGVVYAAHRIDDFEQQAAVKCLQQRWDSRGGPARFLRERSILASLTHPNIARLLDGGFDADGQPWFAMERIDGQRIDAAADAARLDLRQRIRLMLPVCAAVQHAHEHFVVHRDLKPDNLLVDGDGNPIVLDFGVAKLLEAEDAATTRTGLPVAFTPEYAAPEQITGGAITAATDVHALGLVLYRLLTGRMPFALEADAGLPERIAAITRQPPMRPELALTTGDGEDVRQRLRARDTDPAAFRRFVRGDLTRILQTALAKEPGRRYATVQAFATDLRRFLDGRPVSVSGDTFTYRASKFLRRNPWGSALAASLAAVAIGFGLYAAATSARIAAQAQETAAERDRAQAIADFLGRLFTLADPTRTSEDLTAGEMLERGVSQLDQDAALGTAERGAVLTAIGGVHQVRGEYDRAHDVLQRAVALERADAPDQPLANSLLELSKVETRLGRHAEAEAHAREALAVLEAISADGAHRASALNQIALALSDLGRQPEAAAMLEQVVQLRSAAAGDEQQARNLAANYNNLGLIYTELGRLDEAEAAYDASLALVERQFGSEHPYVAFLLGSRAELQEQRGNPAAARDTLEQALAIAETHLGDAHPFVADVHYRLGRLLAAAGEAERARERLQHALDLQRQALPADHPDIAHTLGALGALDAAP